VHSKRIETEKVEFFFNALKNMQQNGTYIIGQSKNYWKRTRASSFQLLIPQISIKNC